MSLIDRKQIDDLMLSIADDLVESQRSKGLRASGQSANSLVVRTGTQGTQTVSQLRGVDYWRYQQQGRSPGKYPKPSKRFVQAIKEWLSIRGLDYSPYAVAFKINRDGIRVPNRFNPGGVLNPLDPERVKAKIKPLLRSHILKSATSMFFK